MSAGGVTVNMWEPMQACVSVRVSMSLSGDVIMCESVHEWICERGCERSADPGTGENL